ncbi:MAG: response regulator [Dehalococcoidia bacterium]
MSPNVCLVVEDEPAILRLVKIALQDLGVDHILPAPSAEAALQLLEESELTPSIAITDVRLPGIGGVELTRRIKADARFLDIPVLLMSAYGEPREHEGDAFLAKPFDVDEFAEFVSPYLVTSE